jgi:tRNA(fMet)-specific endonuclease VapC
MLVFDTDHLVEFDVASAVGEALRRKLEDTQDEVATTIISAEEQFRGWLAQIRRQHDPHQQIDVYKRLQRRIDFFAAWNVLPWDRASADILQGLRKQRIRIGTMDLKIASIALAHNATLLSRNLRDFERVPNLRVEDWLS